MANGIPIWDEVLDADSQCRKCARFDKCDAVWKNPDAEWVTCVGNDPVRTNADRIRTMTDEELAEWLFEYAGSAPNCDKVEQEIDYGSCVLCWSRWLKEVAEDGEC